MPAGTVLSPLGTVPPLAARIHETLHAAGQQTKAQLARQLFGPCGRAADVHFACELLVCRGLVERLGAGGRLDPYRFRLATA